MRLGFLFDEEYTDWIIMLADYMNCEPYEFLKKSIDTMVAAYSRDDDDAEHRETVR